VEAIKLQMLMVVVKLKYLKKKLEMFVQLLP